MASPTCEVKDGAGAYASTIDGVDVTAEGTFVIRLESTADVDSWSIACLTTDELGSASTINAGLVIDSVAKTATGTAPVGGRALRFQSQVNGGIDRNGVRQPSYTTTLCIYTPVGGLRVHALDEKTEGNAVAGWGADINAIIRASVSSPVTPLDASHIHAWELDDASGNFVDTGSSASKVNLTVTGTPLYHRGGLLGDCVIFNRSDAGASVTSCGSALISAFSDLPLTNATLEVWFKSERANVGYIIGGDHTAGRNFQVWNNGAVDALAFNVQTVAGNIGVANLTGLSVINPGVWHYLAAVYDTTNSLIKLYLDGEVIAQAAHTGNIQWTNGTSPKLWVGGSAANAGITGSLSRYRLSNIVRSRETLLSVYQRGMGR
jgi:hypothetical protein